MNRLTRHLAGLLMMIGAVAGGAGAASAQAAGADFPGFGPPGLGCTPRYSSGRTA